MSYRKEFPTYHDPFVLQDGFVDSSWHNDVCPSMANEGLRLHIFLDWVNPLERDIGGVGESALTAKTYSVHRMLNEHGELGGGSLLETDSWDEVLEFIEKERARGLTGI